MLLLEELLKEQKFLQKVGMRRSFDKHLRLFLRTLLNSYACYLSTTAGPITGTLYASIAKLAFCSDNPLSYKGGDQTQWSYYKVLLGS
ncbi:hypothetical protein ACSBR2_033746 [Camellia fascicularis]